MCPNSSTDRAKNHPGSSLNCLDSEHLLELEASAISRDVIAGCGVYSAHSAADLPASVQWVAKHSDSLPALVYPAEEVDGTSVVQVKPACALVLDPSDPTARAAKYVSGSKQAAPQLPLLRRPSGADPVWLIVEGVKQSLAALSWAPPEVGVLRIAGIYGWMREGVPTPHLDVVDGAQVVVVADADARTNRTVYEGAAALGEACLEAGAVSVVFATAPGGANTGLDDFLASRPAQKRAAEMLRLMGTKQKKPAAKCPPRRIKDGKRRAVYVNAERGHVAQLLCDAVLEHASGEVFERAKEMVRVGLNADGQAEVEALTSSSANNGVLLELLSECAVTLRSDSKGNDVAVDPTAWQLNQMLTKLKKRARSLRGISQMPLLTRSGALVLREGYEAESKMYVRLSSDLADLHVPQTPSRAEVEDAVGELQYLLQDFEFATEADRTRALAMLVTAVVRPSFPKCPLWMLTAVKPGQGKGKLAALGSILMTGQTPSVQPYPSSDEEVEKVVTSKVLAGSTSLFLDEARGVLASSALQALVTSDKWAGRVLGETKVVEMDHAVHLVVAGNNLALGVDMARRVMPVQLYTELEDPSVGRSFVIPDLEEYAAEHRRDLVAAVLTIVRNWYALGCPSPTEAGNAPTRIGTFEKWQEVVGGALEAAGVTGLMDGVLEMRESLDDGSDQWAMHFAALEDLASAKPGGLFTVADVVSQLSAQSEPAYPPELDLSSANPTYVLGRAYMSIGAVKGKRSAWYGGRSLVVDDKKTRAGSKQYRIETRAGSSAGAAAPAVSTPTAKPEPDLFEVEGSAAPMIADLGESA